MLISERRLRGIIRSILREAKSRGDLDKNINGSIEDGFIGDAFSEFGGIDNDDYYSDSMDLNKGYVSRRDEEDDDFGVEKEEIESGFDADLDSQDDSIEKSTWDHLYDEEEKEGVRSRGAVNSFNGDNVGLRNFRFDPRSKRRVAPPLPPRLRRR